MDEHAWWYFTRASGFVAYVLLFASVSLGLAMTGNLADRWLRRYRVYDLHRFLSLLTLIMAAFHVFIVLPDDYIGFTLPELLVPLASPYRPAYIALGTLALYLLGAVIGSFYLRRFVGYRGWRLLHYATLGVFVLALVHAVGAGTDTPAIWARVLYASTAVAVFNLCVWRLLRGEARGLAERERPSAALEASRQRAS